MIQSNIRKGQEKDWLITNVYYCKVYWKSEFFEKGV